MRLISAALSVSSLLVAGHALACPSCETALQARAELSERGDFWRQLLIIMLPLVLMSFIASVLHRTGTKTSADVESHTP